MQKTKHKIEEAFPEIKVELISKQSKGDQLLNIPLQTVEGSDFFTQDIFDALQNGEADIAVHSLKDMSATHFFGKNKFAIIDRDDARDVAIFNSNIENKIKQGNTIIIGTCSPRREKMAIDFLKCALPQFNANFTIQTKTIRGNVDSRLRKLNDGEYDGIILATAGINRLLESTNYAASIQDLLANKKLMLLPLIECVPAPCQGAIVAEAHYLNSSAVKIIETINNKNLMQQCLQEKKEAVQYGSGCLQKFGVTTIQYNANKFVMYAAGINEQAEPFVKWSGLPTINIQGNLFDCSNYMGSFFSYKYLSTSISIPQQHVYIANYKAVKNKLLIKQLQNKTIWAAGSKTWLQLAKQNIWVTGCADAMGLEFLEQAWKMPLIQLKKNDVAIVTSKQGAETWSKKNWNTIATYSLLCKPNKTIQLKLSKAAIIFWTNFLQYQQYQSIVSKKAVHCCPSGETAVLLKKAGIKPIVFPNIKSFLQWKK